MLATTPRSAVPIVAHGLFSYQIGGSERVGADLALEFAKRGYEVVCFAFYDTKGPIRAELEAQGVVCVDLNYESRLRLTRKLTYQLEMYRFLRRYRVDKLVVHHATALVLCGIAARLARISEVMMIEHAIFQLRERADYRRQARRFCRFASTITGVNQEIVDYFRDEMGTPPERLKHIPNGVRLRPRDAAMRRGAREMLGLDADQFAFLFVGRLQPQKDVATLISAAAFLPAELRHGMQLLIAGDGPLRETLEANVASLGLRNTVRFLGVRRDVPDLLAAADGFVMSSITEGQPMALIEAMSADLPCIATSVGGIPALLGDDAGMLVAPSAPAEIAAAMARMMRNPEQRATIVERARERIVESHSLDAVVNKYLAALGLPPSWPPP